MKKNEEFFKEEVPEEELHSKVDVDDHIYVEHYSFFGGRIVTILAIILALTALLSTIYGLLSLDKNLDERNIGVIKDEYHLTVIHSNDLYGGKVTSLSKYKNNKNYYSYKFSVANNNKIDLDYAVAIKNKKGTTVDISLVDYDLVKNGSVIKSGKLSNIDVNKIYGTAVLSKTTDEYEIRFWSNNADDNTSFVFEVEILV